MEDQLVMWLYDHVLQFLHSPIRSSSVNLSYVNNDTMWVILSISWSVYIVMILIRLVPFFDSSTNSFLCRLLIMVFVADLSLCFFDEYLELMRWNGDHLFHNYHIWSLICDLVNKTDWYNNFHKSSLNRIQLIVNLNIIWCSII